MPASELLPQPLPRDPMPVFEEWFRHARACRLQPNPDAMVLASVDEQGRPSARVVLCKHIASHEGYIVFFTNYASRKGRELIQRPYAAVVFHWDGLHRQVRMEGRVVRSPPQESDAYFATRTLESRIGAWASEQSAPLASRSVLQERVRQVAERFGIAPGTTQGDVPRPPHWGGFRLWIESLELWTEGAHRIHDRAVWRRNLEPRDEYSFTASDWETTRLYP
ncbi:MAG: pyridoxamine 5'-phosphate oxidase [Gammaproteobacteria bacterium]|nr:pyridoxamine 5'-phosphate oxidase [Gammaproteobacteria bacterium]